MTTSTGRTKPAESLEVLVEVRLSDGPVPIAAIEPFPASCGAECLFVGRTRREMHEQHGLLIRLSYEAYRPMAEDVLRGLAQQAVERFGCKAVRVVHAVGEVGPGEASVIVQTACGHRAAAFESCRFLIDELKKVAPIWKREEWADGTTWAEGAPAGAEKGTR